MAHNDHFLHIEDEMRQENVRRQTAGKDTNNKLSDQPDLDISFPIETKSNISEDLIQKIAHTHYKQPVVSLYLNMTPDKVIRDPQVFLTFFNSLKHAAIKKNQEYINQLTREQRGVLDLNIEDIEKYLRAYFTPDQTRSLVLFISGDELRVAFSLMTRTSDHMTIGETPYTLPATIMLQNNKPVLAASISRGETLFYEYSFGEIQHLHTIHTEVPQIRADATQKDQMNKDTQAHSLDHLRRHLKESSAFLEKYVELHPRSLVAIEGEISVTGQFIESYISHQVKDKLLGSFTLSTAHLESDLKAHIKKLLSHYSADEELKEIDKLHSFKGTGQIVTGLHDVLKAQNRFIISMLFVKSDQKAPGYRCVKHDYLTLEMKNCPMCDTAVIPVDNIYDELVEIANKYNVKATLVHSAKDNLDVFEGVAGVTYNPEQATQMI